MPEPSDFESRLTNVEQRLDAVEVKVRDARHLAAFHDRDLADIARGVDANRTAINALGVQTAGGFANVRAEMRAEFANVRAEMRDGFAAVDAKFAVVDSRFDETRAGLGIITSQLSRLLDEDEQSPEKS